MHLSRRSFLVLMGLALTLAAAPAFALSLDEAKAAGLVGERIDGYLGVVPASAPADAKALVKTVNNKRKTRYASIAKKNGTTTVAVAALAGKKLVNRTPKGQYVTDADGRWVKK